MLTREGTRPLSVGGRAWLSHSRVEDGVLDFVLEGRTDPEEYLNIFFLGFCSLASLIREGGILLFGIQPMCIIFRVMDAHRRRLKRL